MKGFVICAFTFLTTYDFFINSFVSYSLLAFLILNILIDQMSKLWGKELLLLIKLILIILVFYVFNWGILSFNFLFNFICILGFILVRRVVKGGYFRFN